MFLAHLGVPFVELGVCLGAVGCISLCGSDSCVVPRSIPPFDRRCCTLAFSPVFDRELASFFVPEVWRWRKSFAWAIELAALVVELAEVFKSESAQRVSGAGCV